MKDWTDRTPEERSAILRAILSAVIKADRVVRALEVLARKPKAVIN